MSPDFRLLLITNRQLCESVTDLTRRVREACIAGVRAIQLREKDLPGRDLLHLAGVLRDITRQHGAALFVNDRADVARAVGADGLQCPEHGTPPHVAIRLLGASHPIGASVHSIERAVEARRAGASFVTFGPVFDTPSKVGYGPPQGVARLGELCKQVDIPVFAVGGIDPSRALECTGAGATGVAVISGIIEAADVAVAVSAFHDSLGGL